MRVYLINGWYIITYGLGIYVLNLLIGFLSPQSDPESEGPVHSREHHHRAQLANVSESLPAAQTLPTSRDDEFRPFIRRLPEFKFWYALTKAFCVAFIMTFFSIFNIPVFWPILLLYFVALFVLTMKRQIKHMIKCARRNSRRDYKPGDAKTRWRVFHRTSASSMQTLRSCPSRPARVEKRAPCPPPANSPPSRHYRRRVAAQVQICAVLSR